MAGYNNLEKRICELIENKIASLGYELYDVEYLKEGKEYHLCIYVEKVGGMNIKDCELINNEIEPILDEVDPIKEQYFLEISSTGIEKKLRTIQHYKKQVGNKVEVKLFAKVDGNKVIVGVLKDVKDNFIIVDNSNKEIKISFEQIATAKTIYDWNS